MKKIIFNALQYKNNSSGIGIMIRELFSALCRITPVPYQIILPKNSHGFPCDEKAKVSAPFRYEQSLCRVLYQTLVMGIRYCRNAILLTVDSKIPLLLPKSCYLLPVITDLALFRLPETYQTSRVVLWKWQYRFLLKKATRFVAISEFTKKELMDCFSIPAENISVVPCACDTSFSPVTDTGFLQNIAEKYHLPQHYILFVGNLNPRKNLRRLIEAFDRMKTGSNLPHELVIVGGKGWKFSKDDGIQGIAHSEKIHFLGYVADADMPAIYSLADLFAFPSLYEGFGMPILEAQSCGTPVLTSNCSSLPEVGGEGAVYINPYNVDEIAEKMQMILSNPNITSSLQKKGAENALRYSWEKSAQLLNTIIENVR